MSGRPTDRLWMTVHDFLSASLPAGNGDNAAVAQALALL